MVCYAVMAHEAAWMARLLRVRGSVSKAEPSDRHRGLDPLEGGIESRVSLARRSRHGQGRSRSLTRSSAFGGGNVDRLQRPHRPAYRFSGTDSLAPCGLHRRHCRPVRGRHRRQERAANAICRCISLVTAATEIR